jgi:hypothetical protein
MKHLESFNNFIEEGKKKGLWANIEAKRKRGEKPAKPGDKDYPDEEALKSAQESITNESDEVSVDKIMTAAEKKKLKDAFENYVIGVDKLAFKKDGTIEAKRGYFYRHGESPEKVADKLKSALSSQGIEIQIVRTYDDFRPWPKDSNFVVVFKLV